MPPAPAPNCSPVRGILGYVILASHAGGAKVRAGVVRVKLRAPMECAPSLTAQFHHGIGQFGCQNLASAPYANKYGYWVLGHTPTSLLAWSGVSSLACVQMSQSNASSPFTPRQLVQGIVVCEGGLLSSATRSGQSEESTHVRYPPSSIGRVRHPRRLLCVPGRSV